MRIVLTGPESSGKTTLTEQLSLHYKGRMIPEFAREYLSKREGVYTTDDILKIAETQWQRSHESGSDELQFEDTDLLTVFIWLKDKYGMEDPGILGKLCEWKPDLYLYCSPDLLWQPDPLREDPHRLHILGRMHLEMICSLSVPFAILCGRGRVRLNRAKFYTDAIL